MASRGLPADERRAHRNVVATAAIAGLGGLLFGYDTGIIASALLFVKKDFDLGSFEQGMVVSSVPVGAIFGAAAAGVAADRLGRRYVIIAAAVVFIIGALLSAASPDLAVLVIARVLLGVAVGLASANAPVYISEVAPPEERGRLVSYFQLSVTVGILVAYLVGLAFSGIDGWRWMLGLGAVPALALGIGMLEMPQSPRWLVMVGQDYAARKVLEKIRSDDEEAITEELEEIKGSIEARPGSWRDLLEPAVRAALLVGVGLAVLQQVTGINTVIYYAPTIIQFTGINGNSAAIVASLGVGVINIGATLVALRLIDQRGRRPLLMVGVTGMAIALFVLGLAFLGNAGTAFISAVAIISLMAYVATFAISLGPVFWLMNSEIYPLKVRSKAAGVGTMANWSSNFVISLTFLPLINLLGRTGAFWAYAVVGLFTLWFCWKLVPETKDRELEEIEAIFRERAGR
ncbi:MAG TPA: sugar porter family MFS transporter [Solirubrobacterales bacterium]|jgi:sugar porter (SP) family MFS transporter